MAETAERDAPLGYRPRSAAALARRAAGFEARLEAGRGSQPRSAGSSSPIENNVVNG
jgi:hypothetical protein